MKLFQSIFFRRRRRTAPTTLRSRDPGGATLRGLWSEYTGDPIYGRSLTLAAGRGELGDGSWCVHCGLSIRHVAGQGWVHAGVRGTFGCRDGSRAGMFTGTYAEPATVPGPGPVSGGGVAGSGAAGDWPPAVDGLVLHGGSGR